MRTFLIVTVFAVTAAGCSAVEVVRDYSAKGAARLLIAECQLSEEARRKNRDAITIAVRDRGRKFQAVAQDCNPPFDGKPDF